MKKRVFAGIGVVMLCLLGGCSHTPTSYETGIKNLEEKNYTEAIGNFQDAVKEEDPYTCTKDLPEHINVATSFPNIAEEFLKKAGKKPKIIEVTGATEITPRLGLADVVVDITSSGSTLKSNKLKVIDKILSSSAVVAARKGLDENLKKQIHTLLVALKSVLEAREKKYLMANVPKDKLDEIRTFLPGFTAPTVMPMMGDDKNVVIHVVVDADKVFDSVEKLKTLGGQGILIMTVDQMVR